MDQQVMPGCGLECIAAFLPVSECSPADQSCLCLDRGFDNLVDLCVKGSCTVIESLAVKNITSTTCGLRVRNETVIINALRYILFFEGLLFFAMRIASRALRLAPWGHDDTTIVMSGILTAGWLAGSILEERNGLGRDIWTLEPGQITEFLRVFFAFEVLYTLTLGLIKTSILFLYLRIFPDERIRLAVWATQAFNFLLVGSFLAADFLQCRPVSFFWEAWDGEHAGGRCFNINALAWAHSAVNIALDFWMLVIPATQVWSLQMQVRKKVVVFVMFGIGIFLTLASIARIQTLVRFANSENPTRDYFATVTWSYIEITVGVMVACLPGARMFLARYVGRRPKLSKSPSGRSGGSLQQQQQQQQYPGGPWPGGRPSIDKYPITMLTASDADAGSEVELVTMSVLEDDRRDERKGYYEVV